jgi:hypothetical protein
MRITQARKERSIGCDRMVPFALPPVLQHLVCPAAGATRAN